MIGADVKDEVLNGMEKPLNSYMNPADTLGYITNKFLNLTYSSTFSQLKAP